MDNKGRFLIHQDENHVEEECYAEEIEADIVSKKPRDDNAERHPPVPSLPDEDSRLTANSADDDFDEDEDDDDDDDDDDDWEMQSDGEDFLDDAEDDVSTVSEATRFELKFPKLFLFLVNIRSLNDFSVYLRALL
jgi:hypothetical protein